MSLKPFKKSDLDKGWMKGRRDKPIKIQLNICGTGNNTLGLFQKAKQMALSLILNSLGLGCYEKNRSDIPADTQASCISAGT